MLSIPEYHATIHSAFRSCEEKEHSLQQRDTSKLQATELLSCCSIFTTNLDNIINTSLYFTAQAVFPRRPQLKPLLQFGLSTNPWAKRHWAKETVNHHPRLVIEKHLKTLSVKYVLYRYRCRYGYRCR